MSKELFCPKCFSFDVRPTFAIGSSCKVNIVCRNCDYEGLGLEGTREYVEGLKRFSELVFIDSFLV